MDHGKLLIAMKNKLSNIQNLMTVVDEVRNEIYYQNSMKSFINQPNIMKNTKFPSPLEHHSLFLTKQFQIHNKYKLQKPKLILLLLIKKLHDLHNNNDRINQYSQHMHLYHEKHIKNGGVCANEIKSKNIIEKEFPYKKEVIFDAESNIIYMDYIKNKAAYTDRWIKNYDDELFIVTNKQLKLSKILSFNSHITIWTKQEKNKYINLYSKKPKYFSYISQSLGTKSVSECVEFFYKNQKSIKKSLKEKRKGTKIQKHKNQQPFTTPVYNLEDKLVENTTQIKPLSKMELTQQHCLSYQQNNLSPEQIPPPLQPLSSLTTHSEEMIIQDNNLYNKNQPFYNAVEHEVANILIQLSKGL